MGLKEKGTYSDKITLYIPREVKQEVIPKAQEIFRREDSSMSKWFIEMLKRYVEVHAEGNPQLRIDKFSQQILGRECFFCKGHFPILHRVRYASGLVVPTCDVCLKQNRAKKAFSTVKKVLGVVK